MWPGQRRGLSLHCQPRSRIGIFGLALELFPVSCRNVLCSNRPLQTTTAFPEGWMTREFWRYDRSTHTLKLPTGLVYTFGHVAAPV